MDPKDFDDTYEENIESSTSSFIKDVSNTDTLFDEKVGTITGFVSERYKKAEDARLVDEERWMRAYRNYRGMYSSDVQFTEAERSRIFVKVTKTKTLAAYGQVIDVLFGNSKFPITVDPTTLPEGVTEAVHFDANPQADQAKEEMNTTFSPMTTPFSSEEKLQPGETLNDLQERLAGMKNKLAPVEDKLVEGAGTLPTSVTFFPAQVAAKKMQKKIHDQLEESGANKQLRLSIGSAFF